MFQTPTTGSRILAASLTDMCKTVFIATKELLTEIPFDETAPNFALTEITDEFDAIKYKFSNKNIYLVNTSRGCGCDFSTKKIADVTTYLANEKEQMYPMDKIAERFRTLLGRQEEWAKKHLAKVKGQVDEDSFFIQQTQTLISLIKDNVLANSNVELYCCWSGDYDAQLVDTKFINIDDQNFFDTLDLDLNEKIIIGRPTASS